MPLHRSWASQGPGSCDEAPPSEKRLTERLLSDGGCGEAAGDAASDPQSDELADTRPCAQFQISLPWTEPCIEPPCAEPPCAEPPCAEPPSAEPPCTEPLRARMKALKAPPLCIDGFGEVTGDRSALPTKLNSPARAPPLEVFWLPLPLPRPLARVSKLVPPRTTSPTESRASRLTRRPNRPLNIDPPCWEAGLDPGREPGREFG